MEDRKFLQTMDEGIEKVNGHYQLPLPFRNPTLKLLDNRIQAASRLPALRRKLLADQHYKEAYDDIIQSMLASGYARKADTSHDTPGRSWYVPHFGVPNPQKGKLRVVFDFSAKFKGYCLNKELIPGPNLSNLMLGVILRFRKEDVAYMADLVHYKARQKSVFRIKIM